MVYNHGIDGMNDVSMFQQRFASTSDVDSAGQYIDSTIETIDD